MNATSTFGATNWHLDLTRETGEAANKPAGVHSVGDAARSHRGRRCTTSAHRAKYVYVERAVYTAQAQIPRSAIPVARMRRRKRGNAMEGTITWVAAAIFMLGVATYSTPVLCFGLISVATSLITLVIAVNVLGS